MVEFGKNLKGIWLKGMEAISNTASSIASNTKYKVDEMNIVNRRREILSDFGAQAYELWQKGEQFPEALDALLKELNTLDEELNAIRTEKLAGVKTDAEADAAPSDAQEEDAAKAEGDDGVPTLDMPEEAEEEADGEAAAAETEDDVPTISYTAAAEEENVDQPKEADEQKTAPDATEPEA